MLFSVHCIPSLPGSRDRSIKLWNTLGECKYTMADADAHQGWVSCVRFSPVSTQPIIVSGGWDKVRLGFFFVKADDEIAEITVVDCLMGWLNW